MLVSFKVFSGKTGKVYKSTVIFNLASLFICTQGLVERDSSRRVRFYHAKEREHPVFATLVLTLLTQVMRKTNDICCVTHYTVPQDK